MVPRSRLKERLRNWRLEEKFEGIGPEKSLEERSRYRRLEEDKRLVLQHGMGPEN